MFQTLTLPKFQNLWRGFTNIQGYKTRITCNFEKKRIYKFFVLVFELVGLDCFILLFQILSKRRRFADDFAVHTATYYRTVHLMSFRLWNFKDGGS